MYRAFRGAEPDKMAMLVARGLVEPEDIAVVELLPVEENIVVDTRQMARERAERSRRERAEAKMKADSIAMADSLAKAETVQIEGFSSVKQTAELPTLKRRDE